MRYLFALDLKSLLVLTGVSFFGLTLYSEEIIEYLVEVDVINSEVSERSKQNLKSKKESKLKDLELINSNFENKKAGLKSIEQQFLDTEMALNALLDQKKETEAKVEKLKFELVDQENRKKLVESKSKDLLTEIKKLKSLNEGQEEKLSELVEANKKITSLDKKNNNLIARNKALEEEFKNLPKKKEILDKSEELEKKIVRLTKQLGIQKQLIENYEVNSNTSGENQKQKGVLNEPDYKSTMLELKKDHKKQIEKLNEEIKRIDVYQRNFKELNGIKVVFSGFMGYDLDRKEIIFMTREGQKIMMVQDNFTGALVGECGLPVIASKNETRCAATIIARLLFHKNGPIMKGLEIVEVRKK